jgi:hypothetical protein
MVVVVAIVIVVIMMIVAPVIVRTALAFRAMLMRSRYRHPASGLCGEIGCRPMIVSSIHR